jgi:hypothetical protein
MGMMKKAARRATPRSVRKAKAVVKHPVGTAARAATPRSVRSAKRTVFNATHPVNTAENALLRAATPKRKRRPKRKGTDLSSATNAAIVVFVVVALIAGLVGGDAGAEVGGIVAFVLAAVVYLLLKLGEASGQTRVSSARTASGGFGDIAFPKRVTTAWLRREVPTMSEASYERLIVLLASRGWEASEIDQRVRSLRAPGLGG